MNKVNNSIRTLTPKESLADLKKTLKEKEEEHAESTNISKQSVLCESTGTKLAVPASQQGPRKLEQRRARGGQVQVAA